MTKNFIIKKEEKNFTIKKFGQPGLPGVKGEQGDSATIEIGTVTSGEIPSITNVGTDTDAIFNFVLAKGDKGDDGASSTLQNVGEGVGVWKETIGSIASLKSIQVINSILTINQNENNDSILIGIDTREFNNAVNVNLEQINEQLTLIQSNLDDAVNSIYEDMNTNIGNIYGVIAGINTSIDNINSTIGGISGQLNTNTIAINTINGQITSINNSISTINGQITTLQSQMTTANSNINTNTTNISTNTSDISGLKTRMTTAESNISTNTTNIGTNTSDISTLNTKVLPSGGTTGQVLSKTSNTNYAVAWTNPPSSVSEGSGTGGVNTSNVYSKNGLSANTTGARNNAFGYNSLQLNTTGNDNNAFGYNSLQSVTTGNYNTAFGSYALSANTASFNTAFGYQALKSNTSGTRNTGIGYNSLNSLITATDTTAIGYNNLNACLTGGFSTAIGTNNANLITNPLLIIAIGNNNITTLTDNIGNKPQIAIGTDNLKNLNNTGVGCEYNIAIGWSALLQNTSGRNNIAIGQSACTNNQVGEETIGIGKYAMINGGSDNTGLGYQAGSNGTYTNATALGAYTLQTNQTVSNVTAIGYQSDVTGSNQVQLGNSATTTYAYGAIQNRSDERDKANIRDNVLSKEFIMGLKPKQWQWNYRSDYIEIVKNDDGTVSINQLENDGSKTRIRFHNGFIAQDVLELMRRLSIDFAGLQHHSVEGGQDVYTLGYEQFISPMVNTIQEQERTILSMQSTINDLALRLTALENKG